MLLSLPFGAVAFSSEGSGAPLPSTVADGDLDGDLYFVCWDQTLLAHLTPLPPPPPPPSAARQLDGPDTDLDKLDNLDYLLPEDKERLRTGSGWLAQVPPQGQPQGQAKQPTACTKAAPVRT